MYNYHYTYNKKRGGRKRAASLQGKEREVIATVAACAVGVMTSLPL